MISRRKFVSLCTYLIKKMREKITVRNQISGYLKYHKEFKENKYLPYLRSYMKAKRKSNPESYLSLKHEIIKKAKVGNCNELAEYLAFKLVKHLQLRHIDAKIKVVSSKEYDHVYVCVKILLKNEVLPSIWEVDAWDPRVIDRSERPDGSIKNEEVLKYGVFFKTRHEVCTKLFKRKKFSSDEFGDLNIPLEGEGEDRTPTREIFTKHNKSIYKDFTVEAGDLGTDDGKVNYSQQRSSWQKKIKR